ncbi:hypothetical protein F4703DRAFT_1946276 [Phycomyces blakesleeanus]
MPSSSYKRRVISEMETYITDITQAKPNEAPKGLNKTSVEISKNTISDPVVDKRLSLYGDPREKLHNDEYNERYTYYHSDIGCIPGKNLLELAGSPNALNDLLAKENYWININSPSSEELKEITRIFGVHSITAQVIMANEVRVKCDIYKNYMFSCYRTLKQEDDSISTNLYCLLYKRFLLTIHYGEAPQLIPVCRRIERLKSYIVITSDWINYAILNEIVDSLAPSVHQTETRVNQIEEDVLHFRGQDSFTILSRIGLCRKEIAKIHRLVEIKEDIVRTLTKRLKDSKRRVANHHGSRYGSFSSTSSSDSSNFWNVKGVAAWQGHHNHNQNPNHHHQQHHQQHQQQQLQQQSPPQSPQLPPLATATGGGIGTGHYGLNSPPSIPVNSKELLVIPDVPLYLGDVQDHILAMLNGLSHHEAVLARSHSNYLAHVSNNLTKAANSTNEVVGRLTIIATVFVPINVVVGLWGMNVSVPGGYDNDFVHFACIICSIIGYGICALIVASRYCRLPARVKTA